MSTGDDYTHRKNEHETHSETSTNYSRWIGEQIALLEIARDQKLTKQRKQIYEADLKDLPRERLAEAFVRARRELQYFPQIAELRAFAGAAPAQVKQVESVEANAAWDEVQSYVREYGCDGLPTYVKGKGLLEPPALSPRIEYALRRIGGLQALRGPHMDQAFPFLLRDFTAAYQESAIAEKQGLLTAPAVRQQVLPAAPNEGELVDPAEVRRQLLEIAKRMPEPAPERTRTVSIRPLTPPVPLTKQQIEARKSQERAEIERVRKQMEGGGGA